MAALHINLASPRPAGTAQDALAQSIVRARTEGRWVDASIQLERWVAQCRRQGVGSNVAGPDAGAVSTRSRLTPRSRFGRSTSTSGPGDEDEDVQQLRERLPKLRKLIEKEGANGEQVLYAVLCNKINEHGKVQLRLLVLTDQAVYNLSANGQKCKRRIPLSYVTIVTASEARGEFVLHVPSEYDYFYSVVSRGLSLFEEDTGGASASPLADVLDALTRAYAKAHAGNAQLPVRFNENGALSTIVKKKRTTMDSEEGGMLTHQRGDDDDDDD